MVPYTQKGLQYKKKYRDDTSNSHWKKYYAGK